MNIPPSSNPLPFDGNGEPIMTDLDTDGKLSVPDVFERQAKGFFGEFRRFAMLADEAVPALSLSDIVSLYALFLSWRENKT